MTEAAPSSVQRGRGRETVLVAMRQAVCATFNCSTGWFCAAVPVPVVAISKHFIVTHLAQMGRTLDRLRLWLGLIDLGRPPRIWQSQRKTVNNQARVVVVLLLLLPSIPFLNGVLWQSNEASHVLAKKEEEDGKKKGPNGDKLRFNVGELI